MTSHALFAHTVEWPLGRSGPAGKDLLASLKNLDDLGRILTLFLLEGSHTTLRGSSPEGGQKPRISCLLGASPVLTWRRKALFAANTARASKYNLNRSISWRIDLARHPLAGER